MSHRSIRWRMPTAAPALKPSRDIAAVTDGGRTCRVHHADHISGRNDVETVAEGNAELRRDRHHAHCRPV